MDEELEPADSPFLREATLTDGSPEEAFDRFTRLAAKLLRAPVAQLNIVTADRQLSKSSLGPEPWPSTRESPLSHSYCKHVVASGEPLAVEDAREHPLLKDNGATRELGIVAYAAEPLVLAGGQVLGTLCVVDFQPRSWTGEELRDLRDLARAAVTEIELRLDMLRRERGEARLLEVSRLKDLLLEAAGEGIYGLDAEGRTTFVNPAAARLLGYAPEELVGRMKHETIHHSRADGSPYPASACPIHAAFRDGQTRHVDSEVFWRKDGTSFPVEYTSTPVIEDGRNRGAVVTFRDISERRWVEAELQNFWDKLEMRVLERTAELASAKSALEDQMVVLKQAQAQLRESEERFRLMVEGSEEVFFYERDREHRFTYLSPSVESILGYTPEELLGRPYDVLLADDLATTEVHAHTECALEGGVETSAYPARTRHRDGRIVVLEILERPIVRGGEVVGIQGFGRDVTEREWAEAALQASEDRHRAIAELSTDYAYSYRIEPDGTAVLEWVTDAITRITGYTPEEIRARDGWRTLLHPEDVAAADERTRRLLAGHADVAEFRVITKKGEVRRLREHTRPVRDEVTGRVIRIYGAADDITEQRHVEEQLRQSQKMEAIGRLAGGVAHDFNNILTSIKGFTQLAADELGAGHPVRGDLDEAIRSADRAAALTQQLLAFSRQQVLRPRALDLNDIVNDVSRMLGRLVGEDVRLRTRLQADLGQTVADPGQIEQVIMNLVVNARDAMPEGGTLTLETQNVELSDEYVKDHYQVTPGRYVMLAVSDTGHGMPREVQQRIFEPFFTTKEQGKGTGLGLSTVFGIVKQSGGYIWVYSEPGEGTTFKVYLPRVDAGTAVAESAVTIQSHTIDGRQSGTVLLVEDEPAVRAFARRVLERAHYAVLEAEDGEHALRLLETYTGPVHLVVTDVVMPGMSGTTLAQHIGEIRPGTSVVFTSGYAREEITVRGNLPPDVAFVEKPYTPAALVQAVREVLEAQRVE